MTLELIVQVLAGAVVLGLGLWLAQRRYRQTFPRELDEALRIEESDPALGQLLVDQYFMRGVAHEDTARKKLWERAQEDLDAANELRRRLSDDLEADSLIQKDFKRSANGDLTRTLEMSQQSTREQIARLDEMIARIRGT